MAGVRPPPQREAVDVEGAVGCSFADRLEVEREAGRGLSFGQSCLSRKLEPDSDPVQRGRLSHKAGLETSHSKRLVYSNFGNRRSLSGQRAFTQVGKHAPDRRAETGQGNGKKIPVFQRKPFWEKKHLLA